MKSVFYSLVIHKIHMEQQKANAIFIAGAVTLGVLIILGSSFWFQSTTQTQLKNLAALQEQNFNSLASRWENVENVAKNGGSSKLDVVVPSTHSVDNNSNEVIVYSNNKYAFALTTSEDCAKQFVVNEMTVEKESDKLLSLSVYVPMSKQWPKDQSWYGYSVYYKSAYVNSVAQSEYDRSKIDLVLNDNSNENPILVRYEPQDGPDDVRCLLIPVRK